MFVGRLVLVGLVVALSSACRVKTDVGVDVQADGSGHVTVAVGLDEDAVARVGDLGATLRTADLTVAGWSVTGPAKEADGYTWVRAVKAFANPAEATTVFAEISGPTGPFRDFRISVSRSFARTSTRFDGTVDLTGGLAAFADSALAQALDGKPLGEDVAAIERRIGEPVTEVFSFRVAVRLPGKESSWDPRLSDTAPTVLAAKATSWRIGTIALTAAAVVGLISVVVLIAQGRRRTE